MFLYTADSNVCPIAREYAGSAGVIERGERTMVVQAYLGGLTVSAVAGGKVKRSLVNGARFTGCQKSDCFIVVMKPVKAGGAKGAANQQSPEAKHAEYAHGRVVCAEL